MKNLSKRLIIALAAIITFSMTGCENVTVNISTNIAVTLDSVTADGGSRQTTTQLTLTFDKVIAGLSADDITLSGVAGVTKGSLSGDGPVYTLPIGGFTKSGTLSVAAAKKGYDISGSPKTAAIFYSAGSSGGDDYIAVTFSGVRANGDRTQTTTELTLTFDAAIEGLSADDITLSGMAGVTKGSLSGDGPVYTLPISGFTTNGTLNVAVAKSGYSVSGSPRTAAIFYVIPVTFNSVTANNGSTATTTELTLTFSAAIAGLSENDITISGADDVTTGTLSGDGPVYTLPIGGFTKSGTLNVAVEKAGYSVSGSPQQAAIFYVPVPVTFNSVIANGNSTQTTTQLTLTFSQAIPDLSAADITLSGVTGVIRGTLSGDGPVYTLGINRFTESGTLNVAVAKWNYSVSGSPQQAAIFYVPVPVTFNSVSANGSSTQSTTRLTLTFSEVIPGLSAADITLSGVAGVTTGTLSGDGPVYTLGISGFTASGTLNVAVAKWGYNVSGSPKTTAIYRVSAGINIGTDSVKLYLNGSLLAEGGSTTIPSAQTTRTVSIPSGAYSGIIWYLNGSIAAQGIPSITLENLSAGTYLITVEVTAHGDTDIGSHSFVIE